MKNEIALKVYDIDYSFILKNYLAPDLWEKTWTLFVYKNVRVTLDLCEIEVKKPISIRFKIGIQDENFSNYYYITHDTENSNINVLKRQINGQIRDLISCLEQCYIRQEDDYCKLVNSYSDEQQRLREIAEEYLDENNITLDDVREAYIDKYVNDNEKGYSYKNSYIESRKYKNKSDLWLVFYKAIGDDKKYEEICNILNDDPRFNSVMDEIKEYINALSDDESEEYQDYFDIAYSKLEAI